jgi:hypothetical protein
LFTEINADETHADETHADETHSEDVAFCPTCQALEDAPPVPEPEVVPLPEVVPATEAKTASVSERVSTSNEAVDQASCQPVRNGLSPLGIPGKIAWTTPAFRAGWDDAEYSKRSSDSVPTRASIVRRRRRMLLVLLCAVSGLMLLSRLDVTSVEMVWNDWMKAKPADQKRVLPPAPQSENATSPTAE